MGFTNNLDLDELLSYFLSGSLLIAVVVVGNPQLANELAAATGPLEGTAFAALVQFVLLSSLSLILGHILSILVRTVVRGLINKVLFDPRHAVLPSSGHDAGKRAASEFFTNEFRIAFSEKFQAEFGNTLENVPESSVPRMVRSYVFSNSETATAIRERIVRARSFCGNMALSLIIGSLANVNGFGMAVHFSMWAMASFLIMKQRSLDVREAKEIYTHFLVIQK